eukprot:12081967-Alexandrium_andersonii.AAC.1
MRLWVWPTRKKLEVQERIVPLATRRPAHCADHWLRVSRVVLSEWMMRFRGSGAPLSFRTVCA